MQHRLKPTTKVAVNIYPIDQIRKSSIALCQGNMHNRRTNYIKKCEMYYRSSTEIHFFYLKKNISKLNLLANLYKKSDRLADNRRRTFSLVIVVAIVNV